MDFIRLYGETAKHWHTVHMAYGWRMNTYRDCKRHSAPRMNFMRSDEAIGCKLGQETQNVTASLLYLQIMYTHCITLVC